MKLIRDKQTKAVQCWWEEGQGEGLAEPAPRDTQEVVHMPGTAVAEFERGAAQSAGVTPAPGKDGVIGKVFVHDSVPAATKSVATRGRGVKVGNTKYAVEADAPEAPRTLVDDILEARKSKGSDLDAPVSLAELREADLERIRRGRLTAPPVRGG